MTTAWRRTQSDLIALAPIFQVDNWDRRLPTCSLVGMQAVDADVEVHVFGPAPNDVETGRGGPGIAPLRRRRHGPRKHRPSPASHGPSAPQDGDGAHAPVVSSQGPPSSGQLTPVATISARRPNSPEWTARPSIDWPT